MDIKTLASAQKARLVGERKGNRERFPTGAELKDLFAAHGMNGRIVYAENARGETIGKRDPGPWADVRMDGVWA